jgi:predicted O-methyltransferase YrrM
VNFTIDDLRALGERVHAQSKRILGGDEADPRPPWLSAMPGAQHPGEHYYLFLWTLAQAMQPRWSLEIGTRGGTGAFHLADGYRGGRVLTLDIDPGCAREVHRLREEHGVNNVMPLTGDSSKPPTLHMVPRMMDLLFIDGDHTYISSYGDYLRFREKIREGGLIVFDDTRLNDGMTQAWNKIADPKIELPELHYMGFGVAIKAPVAPEAL